MAISYPKSFPDPLVNGYEISVNMGVIRSNMNTGTIQQRRKQKTMPTIFTLEFAVPLEILGSWQTWVNEFAYNYFTINIVSHLTGDTDSSCSPHVIRFITNLSLSPITSNVYSVTVSAELALT